MDFAREGGILLHPTSLPGNLGIGDLGKGAITFIQFLQECGLRLWQILPLGPTGYGNSPYQTLSAFAGNQLLISVEKLVQEDLLGKEILDHTPEFPLDRVAYGEVICRKTQFLKMAYQNFKNQSHKPLHAEFDHFCHAEQYWLEDYALFRALKDFHDGKMWTEWEPELVHREGNALSRWRSRLAEQIDAIRFEQFIFYRQWTSIKNYAHTKNIKIIGDIPIFLAHDSADVWAHQDFFFLDHDGWPTVVAGVPPDYFSETGQRWGNPVYRWDILASRNYDWWIARFKAAFRQVDIARLDHFRGFEAYWEVPACESTAINGRWVKGPGAAFFTALQKELAELPIIAEDLGIITPEVVALRNHFQFPGMRILQFAFSLDEGARFFLPHNYPRNCVVYTGTHDNDTCVGWFTNNQGGDSTRSTSQALLERERALKYMNSDGKEIHWDFIRLAFSSVANTAIVPLQDVLGLGNEARMNLPARAEGNWEWRFRAEALTQEIQSRLIEYVDLYDRKGKVY